VPAVVGNRLVDAERTLVAAGFDDIKRVDATGQDRTVVKPENWVVRSQDPAPGTRAGTHTKITLGVAKPTDASAGPSATSGVIPDVVCRDLQKAQDTLQAAGFYNLDSEDGTGQGRAQIIDSNWVVIRQSAPPGSRPDPGTRIILTTVKFGEPTGAAGCRS
jgi:beta-lactam-binding protein with PASTA domain